MRRVAALTRTAALAGALSATAALPALAADAECDTAARAGQAAVLSVYFDTGRSEIAQTHRKELQRIAEEARYQVKVCAIGQADRQGNPAFNKRLALKRAEAVADVLAAHGVPRSVLVIGSAGEAFGSLGGNAKVKSERRVDVLYPRIRD